MLQVKTYLHISTIQGIGLFAAEFIAGGTLIWRFTPELDRAYTPEEYEEISKLPDFKQVEKYFYKSLSSGNYVLCADNARFINHSHNANTLDISAQQLSAYVNKVPPFAKISESEEGITIAKKDIGAGEEITSDYALFDADYARYKEELISGESALPERKKRPRRTKELLAEPLPEIIVPPLPETEPGEKVKE